MRKTVAVGSAEAVPEAEQARAVLFLDEADSLFGKRTNATDAHDRYANVESTTSCSPCDSAMCRSHAYAAGTSSTCFAAEPVQALAHEA